MVKLMPDSERYLEVGEGGGNRMSRDQIKEYLRNVLRGAGDPATPPPPYPNWGVPDGWGKYLASESPQPALPPRACVADMPGLTYGRLGSAAPVLSRADAPTAQPELFCSALCPSGPYPGPLAGRMPHATPADACAKRV
jgi:hypothetical protein